MRRSPSAQHAEQCLLSFPRATGPFLPIQTTQESFLSLPADQGHSTSALGFQQHPLSMQRVQEPLLASWKPKEFFRAADSTL